MSVMRVMSVIIITFFSDIEVLAAGTAVQSEYRKIWTRSNSVFGHFSCSESNINHVGIVSNGGYHTVDCNRHCTDNGVTW